MNHSIRPAFTKRSDLIGFVLVMAFLLSLPITLAGFGLPKRENIYQQVPHRVGPFGFFHKQIFETQGDIDVLFLGSSLMWNAIDARLIKKSLDEYTGRSTAVLNFGSNWRGEDLYYLLLRDLLQHRKVKMLVTSMPYYYQVKNDPHTQAYRWFSFKDDRELASGLSWHHQIQMYALADLGSPRHLLTALRPPRPVDGSLETLGSQLVRSGRGIPYKDMPRKPPDYALSDMLYMPSTVGKFTFTGQQLSEYQEHMIRRLGDLAQKNGVKLVILNIPLFGKRSDTTVVERLDWTKFFGDNISLIGIAPKELFKQISEEDIQHYYYDDHMNENGTEFFTAAIAPSIVQLYASINSSTQPEK